MAELKHALRFTVTTMVLFGGLYPSLLWGVGRAVFHDRAQGGLLVRDDGGVIGSRLIAQPFEQARYFHPRPSAVEYDAAATGGSNYGPSNPAQLDAVKKRMGHETAVNGVPPTRLPSEMVTASGSGLDPHISPEAAEVQVTRVARARGVGLDVIRGIVRAHTEGRTFGLLGRPRINVLELNLALDAALRGDP